MDQSIYKLKGLDIHKLPEESPLDRWFVTMVQKKVNELSLADISRMLRQDVYIDIAFPVVWKSLIKDPFCGEMYDGQLLELLIKSLEKHPEEKEQDTYNSFLSSVNQMMDTYIWEDETDKEEYVGMIEKLKELYSK